MIQNPRAPNSSLIPPEVAPEADGAFFEPVQELPGDAAMDPSVEGTEEMFDRIAAGLYNLASMLVGQGEQSVRLVENALATADISCRQGALEARKGSLLTLAQAALETIARRDPGALAAPEGAPAPVTCIEDDDLDAAGVSAEELERMFAGPDRDRVREWLANLPTALRTIFALRAVARFSAVETAELLVAHAGPSAANWNAESVREVFRQGLCSLASQLIHASTTR